MTGEDKLQHTLPPNYAAQGERDARLQRLKERYNPPNYLRKSHKKLIKEIKSLEQGNDGKVALCCLCGKLGNCDEMDIHHINHEALGKAANELSNVGPAHGRCNDDENAAYRATTYRQSDHGGKSAQGAQAATSAQENAAAVTPGFTDELTFSSKEGEKGERMRRAWNKAVLDLEDGFFAKQKIWTVKALARAAPWWLSIYNKGENLGSSKTYRVYIEEDIIGGRLIEDWSLDGQRIVRLSDNIKPRIEKD